MKGQLSIIDLSLCDKELLNSRACIQKFLFELCGVIYMRPYGAPVIKKFGKNELYGYSVVQLIETSSITIHLDDKERNAFIDIFSCKTFNAKKAMDFSAKFFKSKKGKFRTIIRK